MSTEGRCSGTEASDRGNVGGTAKGILNIGKIGILNTIYLGERTRKIVTFGRDIAPKY